MTPIDQNFLEKVRQWIEEHKEGMIADIQRFASIPSVSRADLAEEGMPFGRDCDNMLNFALERGEQLGFYALNHDGYCGSIGMGEVQDSIAIVGHLDVVPEGDGWVYPPYAASRPHQDWLVGRGVSDNKGPAVMGLYAMMMLRDLNVPLKHGLRLICGLAEETGMQDLQHFMDTQVPPAIALVPDAGFPVNYAQKGSLSAHIGLDISNSSVLKSFSGGLADNMVPERAQTQLALGYADVQGALSQNGVTLGDELSLAQADDGCILSAKGVSAHAADPEKGKSAFAILANALLKSKLLDPVAHKAMSTLAHITSDCYGIALGIDGEDPDSGKTTLNLGVAYMEEGVLVLHIDSRQSIAADIPAVEEALKQFCAKNDVQLRMLKTTSPFYIDPKDPKAQVLADIFAQLSGMEAEPYTMGGGTYSRVMNMAITYGPGLPAPLPETPFALPENHGGAHQPDEVLYIPNLLKALEIYAVAIVELDKLI